MKIENKKLEINVNENGEVNSIKFKGQEILHDGKEWWMKIYPMMWPNIGISTGFNVKNKNYNLPKHGFWKELKWEIILEDNGITMLATHMKSDIYPFSIDIQQKVSINNNKVDIKTIFSNIDKEVAYFGFGHHPAFKIDNKSVIDQNGILWGIDTNGKLLEEEFVPEKLMDMEFGKHIDTYIYRNIENIDATFEANNLIINVSSNDFKSLMIWKPKDAKFICVEPIHGLADHCYNEKEKAEDKTDIVKLLGGETKTFINTISIQEIEKK